MNGAPTDIEAILEDELTPEQRAAVVDPRHGCTSNRVRRVRQVAHAGVPDRLADRTSDTLITRSIAAEPPASGGVQRCIRLCGRMSDVAGA